MKSRNAPKGGRAKPRVDVEELDQNTKLSNDSRTIGQILDLREDDIAGLRVSLDTVIENFGERLRRLEHHCGLDSPPDPAPKWKS